MAEPVSRENRLELANIVADQEAVLSVAEVFLEQRIVALFELLLETPAECEAVSKVGAQTLVELPAPQDSFLVPVDVVVRVVRDALEGSFGEPELLCELAVHLASIIGTDEADDIDVVGEAVTQVRVAKGGGGSSRYRTRAGQKTTVFPPSSGP